ncbi:hypothetical protein HYU14_07215 [Candidatus Woesearchaeota archaeon]|nr:hypothetical protein [Candidatus Woesearchaeota archaeon]
MYENNYKNPIGAGRAGLESFLQLIADLDEEIELFAIGGTAMVLGGIKESTKDIDFLTTSSPEKIRSMLTLAGLNEKNKSRLCNTWHLNDTRIDIFFDEFILGFSLPDDWKSLSKRLRTIGRLKLFILNWYDIIITKIARSERRDIEDCIAIIGHEQIDFQKLKKRYYLCADTAIISDYDYKFRHMESQWKKK